MFFEVASDVDWCALSLVSDWLTTTMGRRRVRLSDGQATDNRYGQLIGGRDWNGCSVQIVAEEELVNNMSSRATVPGQVCPLAAHATRVDKQRTRPSLEGREGPFARRALSGGRSVADSRSHWALW